MNTARKTLVRKLLFVVISVCIIAAIGAGTFYTYKRWSGQYHSGEIILIREHSFVIQEGKHKQSIISITPETVVKKGPNKLENGLEVGAPVIVIGSIAQDGSIHARIIRIIDKKPRPR